MPHVHFLELSFFGFCHPFWDMTTTPLPHTEAKSKDATPPPPPPACATLKSFQDARDIAGQRRAAGTLLRMRVEGVRQNSGPEE